MAVIPVIDQNFGRRVDRLERKHHKLRTRGARTRVGPDGLVVQYPRRHRLRFPWRAMMALALLGFGFKVWVFAALGAADYTARTEALAAGNPAQQAAAWVMQPEAATEAVAATTLRMLTALRG